MDDLDIDALAWRVAIVPCYYATVSDVPHSPPFAHLRPSLLENVPYFLAIPPKFGFEEPTALRKGVLLGY
jgi:hypothetical protein